MESAPGTSVPGASSVRGLRNADATVPVKAMVAVDEFRRSTGRALGPCLFRVDPAQLAGNFPTTGQSRRRIAASSGAGSSSGSDPRAPTLGRNSEPSTADEHR